VVGWIRYLSIIKVGQFEYLSVLRVAKVGQIRNIFETGSVYIIKFKSGLFKIIADYFVTIAPYIFLVAVEKFILLKLMIG
jgi:hypothetical protein